MTIQEFTMLMLSSPCRMAMRRLSVTHPVTIVASAIAAIRYVTNRFISCKDNHFFVIMQILMLLMFRYIEQCCQLAL